MKLEISTRAVRRRAFQKAKKRVRSEKLLGSSVSAGFILFSPKKPKGYRTGYQVFVKLVAFSERRLIESPETGGLFMPV